MEVLDFNCEIVTPMFAGDAEPNDAAIRSQSIKGLMRFWWRAYNATNYDSIAELRKKEGEIFGTAEGDGNKSSFKIVVNTDDLKPKNSNCLTPIKTDFEITNNLKYLTYGMFNKGSNRYYFEPAGIFKISLLIGKEVYRSEIMDALKLLSIFGGIGSKSHNGFGRFYIQNNSAPVNSVLPDFQDIIDNIKNIQKKQISILFPSFVKSLFYHLIDQENTWYECLNKLCKIYKEIKPELKFLKFSNNQQKNYKINIERKPKPFYLIVHRENNKYRGYILYLHSNIYLSNTKKKEIDTFLNISSEELKDKFENFRGSLMRIIP